MSWELVAAGSVMDAGQMQEYDGFLAEGQRGKLEVDLLVSPKQDVVNWLQNEMANRGVSGARVSTGSPKLDIEFRKELFWLPVIVALVLILVILIVGWRFYREIVDIIPSELRGAVGTGAVIAMVAIAVIAAYSLTKGR